MQDKDELKIIIETDLSNGSKLKTTIKDGVALFTSEDVILLRGLYSEEKKKDPSVRFHFRPVNAISKLYPNKTTKDIEQILLDEIKAIGFKPK